MVDAGDVQVVIDMVYSFEDGQEAVVHASLVIRLMVGYSSKYQRCKKSANKI
jgi:hypothetical protein